MEILQSLSRIPEKHQEVPFIFTEDVSEDGRYVCEAEYWENYYNHPDFNYEWNNGYLEEKPMTDGGKTHDRLQRFAGVSVVSDSAASVSCPVSGGENDRA